MHNTPYPTAQLPHTGDPQTWIFLNWRGWPGVWLLRWEAVCGCWAGKKVFQTRSKIILYGQLLHWKRVAIYQFVNCCYCADGMYPAAARGVLVTYCPLTSVVPIFQGGRMGSIHGNRSYPLHLSGVIQNEIVC